MLCLKGPFLQPYVLQGLEVVSVRMDRVISKGHSHIQNVIPFPHFTHVFMVEAELSNPYDQL